MSKAKMLMTTADDLPGYEITQVLGIVQGNTVRARHVGRDFMASLKKIVGGEISDYTELLQDARDEAVVRMVDLADSRGADAIVAIRFETSDIMQAAAELSVYGTAVQVEKK